MLIFIFVEMYVTLAVNLSLDRKQLKWNELLWMTKIRWGWTLTRLAQT